MLELSISISRKPYFYALIAVLRHSSRWQLTPISTSRLRWIVTRERKSLKSRGWGSVHKSSAIAQVRGHIFQSRSYSVQIYSLPAGMTLQPASEPKSADYFYRQTTQRASHESYSILQTLPIQVTACQHIGEANNQRHSFWLFGHKCGSLQAT